MMPIIHFCPYCEYLTTDLVGYSLHLRNEHWANDVSPPVPIVEPSTKEPTEP